MSKSDANPEVLAKMLKALAHPNRLRLFQEIRRSGGTRLSGPGCLLGQIVQNIKVGAPTVSHHLKELVNAGLVSTERQGKFVHCRVDRSALDRLAAFFASPQEH